MSEKSLLWCAVYLSKHIIKQLIVTELSKCTSLAITRKDKSSLFNVKVTPNQPVPITKLHTMDIVHENKPLVRACFMNQTQQKEFQTKEIYIKLPKWNSNCISKASILNQSHNCMIGLSSSKPTMNKSSVSNSSIKTNMRL